MLHIWVSHFTGLELVKDRGLSRTEGVSCLVLHALLRTLSQYVVFLGTCTWFCLHTHRKKLCVRVAAVRVTEACLLSCTEGYSWRATWMHVWLLVHVPFCIVVFAVALQWLLAWICRHMAPAQENTRQSSDSAEGSVTSHTVGIFLNFSTCTWENISRGSRELKFSSSVTNCLWPKCEYLQK